MAVPWIPLSSIEQVEQLKQQSFETPVVIYKHSTRCGVCSAAKMRLEDGYPFGLETLPVYFLDLLKYRSVSNYVAETFQVHHESPQVLVIRNGECVYDESHYGIRAPDLREAIS